MVRDATEYDGRAGRGLVPVEELDAAGGVSGQLSSDGEGLSAGPSEVALEVALLVPLLGEETREQLRRLLGHGLAVPSAGSRREARLGLLIDLVSDGSGVVPLVAEYEAARVREAQLGRAWPNHSTLIEHFGGWLTAVRTATRLVVDGSAARVPASRAALRNPPVRYSRDDICRVIAQCADSTGEWPSDVLFTEWCRTARLVAGAAGLVDTVRVPRRKALEKHFGTYPNALNAAKRARADGRV